MKQKIIPLILTIFTISAIMSQNIKFYDLRYNEVTLDTNKINLLIFVSTNSCHNCYLEVEKYLESNNAYSNNRFNIVTVSFLQKNDLEDISVRKVFYNTSKYYFPFIKMRIFSDEESYKSLCGKVIDEKTFPKIVLIDNKRVTIFEPYTDFINNKLFDQHENE
ncbi:MAG: redoxin domain-containing protein [Bacteroidales bacterium]|nr:redoxin domain-containing protein [Bacteroidales bacterium]